MNLLYSYLETKPVISNMPNLQSINPTIIAIASMIGIYPVYYISSRMFMYLFDYRYIHISDWQFVCNMSPIINYSSVLTSANTKCGYIASKNFSLFGYLDIPHNGKGYSESGYVYISNKCLADHKLLDEKAIEIKTYNNTKKYTKVYKSAVASYNSNNIYATNICWNKTPTAIQSTIIDKITEQLKHNISKNCVVLLSGTIGAGKSMLCRLLAETLNASIYDEFELCETSFYTFNGVINTLIRPTKAEPTIIVLEEIDTVITSFHNKTDTQTSVKYGRVPVQNKTDWNNFLDRIDYGEYPNVILVMTTNKPRAWFDALDPSYMREGRVNLHIDIDAVAAEVAATATNKDKID